MAYNNVNSNEKWYSGVLKHLTDDPTRSIREIAKEMLYAHNAFAHDSLPQALPALTAFVIGMLLVITYVPAIALALPNWLY